MKRRKRDLVVEKYGLVNGLRPNVHADHPAPVTRRDFIRSGIISGSGLMYTPSIFALLAAAFDAKVVRAQANCPTAGSGPLPVPYLSIEYAGGNSLAGAKDVRFGAHGDPDANVFNAQGLARAGVDPATGNNLVSVGGVRFYVNSPFLAGMRRFTTPAMEANLTVLQMPLISGDDSSANDFSMHNGVAGLSDKLAIAHYMGNENSATLARSDLVAKMANATQAGIRVTGLTSLQNVFTSPLSFANDPNFPAAKVERALAAITKMSDGEIQKLSALSVPNAVTNLIGCQYKGSEPTAYGPVIGGQTVILNPNNDPALTGIFLGKTNPINNTALNFNNSEYASWATMVNVALAGGVNACTQTKGGYDYHGGANQNNQLVMDANAGMEAGAAIALASLRNRPCIMDLHTDGSVSANANSTTFTNGFNVFLNDAGTQGYRMLLIYDPAGRTQSLQLNSGNPSRGVQVGSFGNNGVVTGSSPFANNPALAAEFLLWVIAQLNGPSAEQKFFNGGVIAGGSYITPANAEQWRVFQKMPSASG